MYENACISILRAQNNGKKVQNVYWIDCLPVRAEGQPGSEGARANEPPVVVGGQADVRAVRALARPPLAGRGGGGPVDGHDGGEVLHPRLDDLRLAAALGLVHPGQVPVGVGL